MSVTSQIETALPQQAVAVLPGGTDSWNAAHRVAFRFAFCYLLLYIFPFPFGTLPGSFSALKLYENAWHRLVPWVGRHILHLSYPITVFPNGSGDTTYNYVQLLCYVVIAAVATVLWTAIDRRRTEYRKLHEWLRIYVRYMLGFTMLVYGMDKVIKLQFADPSLQRLAEPLGSYSPFALLWTFMGYSTPYTHFAGAGEVLGAVLVLFRRTTTLGSLILIGVLMNVAMLNFSYDTPVKLFSTHLLLFSCFLVIPDLRRLTNLLIWNQTVPPADLTPPFPRGPWFRIGRLVLKYALLAFAAYSFTFPFLKVRRTIVTRPKSPIYGIYRIDPVASDAAASSAAPVWRELIFDSRSAMTAVASDDTTTTYGADYHDAASSIKISSNEDKPKPLGSLTYSRVDAGHLLLQGDFQGHALNLHLTLDSSKTLLTDRGFHWINERPFYR